MLLLGNHLYIWLILVTLCHHLDKYKKQYFHFHNHCSITRKIFLNLYGSGATSNVRKGCLLYKKKKKSLVICKERYPHTVKKRKIWNEPISSYVTEMSKCAYVQSYLKIWHSTRSLLNLITVYHSDLSVQSTFSVALSKLNNSTSPCDSSPYLLYNV